VARALYSLRIFASGALNNAAGTVGPIVPSEFIYVIRDIDVYNDTAGATDNLVVFAQTGGILCSFIGSATENQPNQQWRGRQVYGPGEQVAVRAFVGTWGVAISGYQLTLP
jgi:hypothetical protein